MKALTVKQPWAQAIIHDGKDVENRSKPTKYRGQLYIHAGKSWEKSAVAFIAKITGKAYVAAGRGLVIGTVDVIDCHEWNTCKDRDGHLFCSAWAMVGGYHWVLANPRPLACPFPETGKLGIWNLGTA